MYIDFPLDGNLDFVQAPHIFSLSPGGPPGRVLAPSCSKSAGEGLEAGGRLGTHPKSGLKGLVKRLAPEGPWRPLEAPGGPGPLRPLETAGGLGAGNPPKSGVRAWLEALGAFRRPLEALEAPADL